MNKTIEIRFLVPVNENQQVRFRVERQTLRLPLRRQDRELLQKRLEG